MQAVAIDQEWGDESTVFRLAKISNAIGIERDGKRARLLFERPAREPWCNMGGVSVWIYDADPEGRSDY